MLTAGSLPLAEEILWRHKTQVLWGHLSGPGNLSYRRRKILPLGRDFSGGKNYTILAPLLYAAGRDCIIPPPLISSCGRDLGTGRRL